MPKTLVWRLGWIMAAAASGLALGQQIGAEYKGGAERRAQATALRDSFVKATLTAGVGCPSTPPKIAVEDVPSYASYDSETNILNTGTWE